MYGGGDTTGSIEHGGNGGGSSAGGRRDNTRRGAIRNARIFNAVAILYSALLIATVARAWQMLS